MTKLSREGYDGLRWKKYVEQAGRCGDCGKPLPLARLAFHHSIGRGIGGGFRDDLDERNRLLCRRCHTDADKHRESKF